MGDVEQIANAEESRDRSRMPSLGLLKKCKHTPRVATKRCKVPCMECRPSWAREMNEKDREALQKKASDIQRRYNRKTK